MCRALSSACLLLVLCSSHADAATSAAAGHWSVIATSGPAPPIGKPWIVLDPIHARLWAWRDSLRFQPVGPPPESLYSVSLASGVWDAPVAGTVYAGSQWDALSRNAVYLHPLLDPVRGRFLDFNLLGSNAYDSVRTRGVTGSSNWSKTATSGSPPFVRYHAGVAYDGTRDRIWLSGGSSSCCPTGPAFTPRDLWSLDLGTMAWTNLVDDPPGCLFNPSEPMFYDPWGDRLLTVRGYLYNANTAFSGFCGGTNAIWELPLKPPYAWRRMSGEPPSIPTGIFVFDPLRGRMLSVDVHDGIVQENRLTADSSWVTLSLDGPFPPTRIGAAVAEDSVADRVIVFGGVASAGTSTNSDVWQLEFDHTTAATVSVAEAEVTPDGVRLRWLTSDINGSVRVQRESGGAWEDLATVVIGGTGEVSYLDPTAAVDSRYEYRIAWIDGGASHEGGLVEIVVPRPPGLTIREAFPRSTDGLVVDCSLPTADPVRIEAFDVNGRRAVLLQPGGLTAGSHAIRVDAGGRLSPGIWFLRIRQAGREATTRAVLLR